MVKLKRFLAYIIDILVLLVLFILLYKILPENTYIKEKNHELNVIEEKVLNNEIDYDEYWNEFIQINYEIDKEKALYSGLNVLLVCLYFIIIPVLTDGKTLGLYLMRLRIKADKKLTVQNLFMRNILTNGILYMVICLIIVSFLKPKAYFYSISILGFIQILLVIISTFMIIYKQTGMGLQDIISKTKIIEDKEV